MQELEPFYDNGKPRYRGEMSNGQMHGFWEFFRRDGSIMRSGSFEYGIQVGMWTTFDRNGTVVKQTQMKNNRANTGE